MGFDASLIAPCGMNCGICKGYLAYSRRIPVSIRKSQRLGFCMGCRPRNNQCAYLKGHCTELKENKISFCYECKDFPCERLRHLDKRYRTNYNVSLIENLRRIKEGGIEKWLAQEELKWRCPRCYGTISVHLGGCFDCEIASKEKPA